MPIATAMTIEAATPNPWLPVEHRGTKLKPSGVGLIHSYETDPKDLLEADWAYLQVALVAYQVHPATVAELVALGPVGGANARRWTIEGPLLHRPGDPGAGANCTMVLEVAHSLTSDPGTDWKPYRPGKYRLRSVKARVTITRPAATYSFRIVRFALLATRVSPPKRPRKVRVADVIPAGMCQIVEGEFEILAGGSLEIEAGASLQVIS